VRMPGRTGTRVRRCSDYVTTVQYLQSRKKSQLPFIFSRAPRPENVVYVYFGNLARFWHGFGGELADFDLGGGRVVCSPQNGPL
jgi:hypothetical protein